MRRDRIGERVHTQSDRQATADALAQFVTLPENRSALQAVRRLGRFLTREGTHRNFPPLYLHGPPGTGKTHLIGGLIERTIREAPDRRAQTVPASDLGRLGDAATEGEADGFLRGARDCDLLIVEDLQHLPPKAAAPLAHLIDYRLARSRCLVVTASAGPAELPRLPARLASRLAAGLVVRLEPLGGPSRLRLLRTLRRQRNLPLTDEVLDWLASRTTGGGARPLLGGLAQLELLGRQFPPPLDLATVTAHLRPPGEEEEPAIERIVRRVAACYRLEVKQLLARDRHRTTLWPRQVGMYLARELTGLSLAQIGAFFGRDHSTVLHACRKVEQAIADDVAMANGLRQLRAELG